MPVKTSGRELGLGSVTDLVMRQPTGFCLGQSFAPGRFILQQEHQFRMRPGLALQGWKGIAGGFEVADEAGWGQLQQFGMAAGKSRQPVGVLEAAQTPPLARHREAVAIHIIVLPSAGIPS